MPTRALYSNIQIPNGQDYIRLVKVHSDLKTGHVSCQLETVHLSEAPSYLALSYTWQSPFLRPEADFTPGGEDHVIQCNSEKVEVFYNLYHALLRLGQEPFHDRSFWIGRISIDQANVAERNHQVDLMAEIFKTAEEVVVWLGPGDEHTKPAIQLMEKLCSLNDEDLEHIRPHTLMSDRAQTSLGPDLSGKSAWLSLSHLFRRNWFGRGWVVQEILFAKKIMVLCGNDTIPWSHLQAVSGFLATTTWTRAFADPRFLNYDKVLPYHNSPTGLVAAKKDLNSKSSFLNSLIRTKRHTCQLPIDKIFSLYGIARMATPEGVHAPQANYNLSVAQAYTEATVNILQSSEDLHVLAYAEGSNFKHVEGLPSWVPDWSCQDVLGLGVTGYKRYHAASRSSIFETQNQNINFHPNARHPKALRLQAAFFDRISACGESKRDVVRTRRIPGWLEILQSLKVQYSDTQTRLEAFWRTIIYDTGNDGLCPARPALGESFQAWLHGIDGLTPDHADLLEYDMASHHMKSEDDALLYQLCFAHRVCLRLFSTGKGFLGLGTESLKVGDLVWLVPGSRVPLILREQPAGSVLNDKPLFELVGGAYLHGFMHGEAFEGIAATDGRVSLDFRTIQLI